LSVAMRMQWLEQPLTEMGQIIGFGDEHDTRQVGLRLPILLTAKCP